MASRREVLAQLAALTVLPRVRWWEQGRVADPLIGTIAAYQAGRARGDFTAVEITKLALERCMYAGRRWNAIDALAADSALAAARASDDLLKAGQRRNPLSGVPMFAKSIYDVNGLPTTGSS